MVVTDIFLIKCLMLRPLFVVSVFNNWISLNELLYFVIVQIIQCQYSTRFYFLVADSKPVGMSI